MKNAQVYDFSITANGSFHLNVEGDNILIISSAGSVEIVTDSMRIGPLRAGQGQAKAPFKRISLNDKSGVANKGTILISSADFIDNRINGEVSVIDGGQARTASGQAYSGAIATAGASTLYAYCAIYNPVGSGVMVVINDIVCSSGVASVAYVSTATGLPSGSLSLAVSKNAGGVAAAKARKYSGNLPGGSIYSNALAVVNLSAGNPYRYVLTEPILLQPGALAAVQSNVDGGDIQATFQFWEAPQ